MGTMLRCRLDRDDDGIFIRSRLLERVELAVQQAPQREMLSRWRYVARSDPRGRSEGNAAQHLGHRRQCHWRAGMAGIGLPHELPVRFDGSARRRFGFGWHLRCFFVVDRQSTWCRGEAPFWLNSEESQRFHSAWRSSDEAALDRF
jgi:hypothetical protein